MEVKVQYSGKKADPGTYYDAWCDISVNGEKIAQGSNFSECPEDANLGRDLRFVYKLSEVLKAAYQAGRDGEPFILEEQENAEW